MNICLRCEEPIVGRRADAKYCTETCKKRSENDRHFIKHLRTGDGTRLATHCKRCGVKFPPEKNLLAQYCSRACKNWVVGRRNGHKRRSTLRSNDAAPFDIVEWRHVQNMFGGRCAYCGRSGPLDQDHVIPLSRGGRHAIANIVPACRSCNSSKGNKFLVEWQLFLTKQGKYGQKLSKYTFRKVT